MIADHYVHWFAFIVMVIGLYTVISHGNLVKKLIGLNLFQIGVFMFYISLGNVEDANAPIIEEGVETYSHPLPHVLILTAIVVGVATTSLGLALVVRIFEAYGTIEEDEVIERDNAAKDAGGPAADEPMTADPDDRPTDTPRTDTPETGTPDSDTPETDTPKTKDDPEDGPAAGGGSAS
ncbi:cation:proton antiporter subunit C [Actinomadura sp. WMMB 499]|uniref:cation:proton antiporter subunit C n=1 Tax=Actinomadura sp. WMMB 499 TaxID=1219491 RepID=UPI0012486285|nr:cation:proton antiporter subunit C [Actinomadura sp. WMMB 499]QFG24604.1 Na+/H+ antiporter subunit C [Actinomadura sp. WMMB 499]